MDTLRRFNGDTTTKEELRAYIIEYIGKEGIYRMFNRQDVSHIADACELITKAFEQLSIDYGIPEKPTAYTNEAR
jgi:hypothetical protein